ncbi:MAG TPA: hypothetical protein VHD76_13530 [Bryobacteraceae bacterium]|jgi:polysaccharide chain length determinant protein (PEP-CTERM system associated)|nr:hypothetical protein [Bryobacteraceae bacterium]
MPEAESDSREALSRVLRIVIQRRWWIALVACGSVAATNGVLSVLPSHYNSEATLLVVQQQIPERYVTPTTSTGLADALPAMTQAVLSRTRLQAIIDEFHLYQKERKRLAPEEVIDLMRHNIDILLVNEQPERRDFNAFKISFTADRPSLAQTITSRLTSLFIEANLKTREDQARNTTTFLAAQLADVERQLSEQERRLRDFKMEHLGELPEQEAGNLAILSGMQAQLQNTTANLSRAQQQQVYFESLLRSYRDLARKGITSPGVDGLKSNPLRTAQGDLAKLEVELDALTQRYTAQHPEVVRVEREIARKKKQIEALKSTEVPAETDSAEAASISSGDQEDTAMAQLKSQIQANRLEIESLAKDEKRLKSSVAEYQARLNSTPIREQQLSEVLRDYDLLKKHYADLLGKQQQSQLAANLEKEQEGQQFQLLDPANLPVAPSGPKRMKMSFGGAVVGLCLGLLLAFLVDARTASFHTENEIRTQFGIAFVLGVPMLLTRAELRRRSWRRSFEWAAGCLLVLLVGASELYVHRLGG